ncbi:MAG: hypothetical protein V3T49_01405 [Dehalococcoidia bacterium]
MSWKKGLTALSVGLAIVLLFAIHPSVNSYHVGFAGVGLVGVFLASIVVGALTRRLVVLSALLFLAFVEPEIRVTNSLVFNIVSNGLIIGAVSTWLLDSRRIYISLVPVLGILGMFALMTIIGPLVAGWTGWIHIHDALMFMKYGMVAVIAASAFRVGKSGKIDANWKLPVVALAAGSAAAAGFTIIQSFHILAINQWVFGTYFGWKFTETELSTDSIALLTNGTYFRAFGVAGQLGTSVLLASSLGGWLLLLGLAKSPVATRLLVFGMSGVLLAIFLTGTRLGMIAAVVVLAIGAGWWVFSSQRHRAIRPVLSPIMVAVMLIVVATNTNYAFGETFATATNRVVSTIPDLLDGNTDASLYSRLIQYSELDRVYFGLGRERDTALNNEYLIFLHRFGPAGFFVTWLAWGLLFKLTAQSAFGRSGSSSRWLGVAGFLAVVAAIVAGIGTESLLNPAMMTIIFGLAGATAATSLRTSVAVPAAIFVLDTGSTVSQDGPREESTAA